MTRRTRLVFLLAVVALVAAGCGSTSTTGTSNSPTSLAGQSVEVVAKWSGTEQANFMKVLDAFAKKTGAKTTYTSAGDDVASFLNQKISGGAPPDLAIIPQPGTVKDLAKKGNIKPLTGDALDSVTRNYSPAWKDLGTFDGKVYGVYLKAAYKSSCWYATDKFTTAGVKEPQTWEDFTATMKTLTDAGITPLAVPGQDAWTITDVFENLYLRVGGADNYDKLADHKIPWTDPTVVETLKLMGDLFSTPKALDGGNAGALKLTFTQSIAEVFGEKPKAAILCEGDFVGSEITKLNGKYKVGQNAKYFSYPSVKGSKPAAVVGGDQVVALKDNKAAMALVAYLASPEAAEIFAKGGGFISPNKSLDQSAYPDDTVRGLADLVVKADVIKFDMSDLAPPSFGGGTNADEWKLLQDFLGNPTDAAGLAQKLEDAAKKDFGSS